MFNRLAQTGKGLVMPRILYLDIIDTLRPDHMGCYGYKRDTTPNIDKIAAEGMVFENYYTSDAPCLPSRASLVSGMFGINSGMSARRRTDRLQVRAVRSQTGPKGTTCSTRCGKPGCASRRSVPSPKGIRRGGSTPG